MRGLRMGLDWVLSMNISPDAILRRGVSNAEGTFGRLTVQGDDWSLLQLQTLELPWAENAVNISCIPGGVYDCVRVQSPRYGWSYEVVGVDGRTNILFHAANWAGERGSEYKSELRGCIALGMRRSCGVPTPDKGDGGREYTKPQSMVVASRQALGCFEAFLGKNPFRLEIIHSG